MSNIRFRERNWRYYRNWLIFMLMWAILVLVALDATRRPWPAYIYFLLAYPAYVVGSSIFYSFRTTYPGGRFAMRNVTPEDAGMGYEKIEFLSHDGLSLYGWFMPGDSRATIILVHGHGSKGIGMIYHTSALVAEGYSVLAYDQRAHGSSEGMVCTAGWYEADDVSAAVAYLKTRPDVDPERIGVLGISMGGKAALLAAARDESIAAVIAEGPSAIRLEDHGGKPKTLWRWFYYPINWLYYKMLAFMNGVRPTEGIASNIAKISPRPLLLIAVGSKSEYKFSQLFYQRANEPKDLWQVPEARHAEAYFHDPHAYQKRIVEFFDQAFNIQFTVNKIS